MTPVLGCIAADFTGATDLASNLTESGVHTVLWLGVPPPQLREVRADAIVVALKTRAIDRDAAVELSLEAYRVLRSAGVRRFYQKYCSTFDSTELGNIGPVADALLEVLQAPQTISVKLNAAGPPRARCYWRIMVRWWRQPIWTRPCIPLRSSRRRLDCTCCSRASTRGF